LNHNVEITFVTFKKALNALFGMAAVWERGGLALKKHKQQDLLILKFWRTSKS